MELKIFLTDNVLEKLNTLAAEKNISVEDYCFDVLTDHVMLLYYEDMNKMRQENKTEGKIEKTTDESNKDNDVNVKPNDAKEKVEVVTETETVTHIKRKLR